MITNVYIDGYNLYFGRIKPTNYKWLDLHKLFSDNLIKTIEPQSIIAKVKYFTADTKAKFSSHGQKAVNSQVIYHQALQAKYPKSFEILKGYYAAEKSTPIRFKKPPDKNDRVCVWKLEEKQTDVLMALEIYRDAVHSLCEQIVVCTNDTDLVPAILLVKKDFPQIKIGIIIPRHEQSGRPANKALVNMADWKRTYITDAELELSQLPEVIPKPNGKGVYRKPTHW
ncbi:MAG: NYN domain-containing protein [Pseudomonadales bacterium]|nr:NYN domain-containing protein [Pseudomonadales bacterium]